MCVCVCANMCFIEECGHLYICVYIDASTQPPSRNWTRPRIEKPCDAFAVVLKITPRVFLEPLPFLYNIKAKA